MQKMLSFDDILIIPKFSSIKSRSNVDTTSKFLGRNLRLPIISSNMDCISESKMCKTLAEYGAIGCLHRFMSIERNVKEFKEGTYEGIKPLVSIGVGKNELDRAIALADAGADVFIIDLAHGASVQCVQQYDELRNIFGDNISIVVGNFSSRRSIEDFLKYKSSPWSPNAFKLGIGGGSMCSTRVVTGCGLPTLASVMDCKGIPIIADGGIKNSGDMVKALAAGANSVMLGGLLSGTEETPGNVIEICDQDGKPTFYKKYRGSASYESYIVQGKVSEGNRSPEGESTLVTFKGSVKGVLDQLEGGLRSAMSYVDANNLNELKENAEFVRITSNGLIENLPHGVKR